MHVVGGAGSCIVRIFHAVLHEPHGGSLQIVQAFLELLGKGRHFLVVAVGLTEITDFLEIGHDSPAAIGAEFAANQVKRLNAIGAFIEHGYT